ncbi:MAG TPA: hypothetical protein VNG51_05355 [Ktedonobacteraceae bacterium]|nr:hypothetical protein [Ktedonobacteraceae bacterium]
MAIAKRPPVQQKTIRRIWRTPASKWNWFFLASSLFILGWVYLIYRSAIATQLYPGPYNYPFRQFGIVAFGLVLLVAAYTLRRRFVRNLPGKVHDWLWLHIWFGIISLLIACMHNNFQSITYNFSFLSSRFTEGTYGTTALYALLLLVLTGITGRLLDFWQARVIAAEADTNGVGITRSVEDRLLDLSLTIERLRAGKSVQFNQYCEQAMRVREPMLLPLPALPSHEAKDFQRVGAVLVEHARLACSLRRQQHARLIIRAWRYIHIPLACAASVIIMYHSLFELWKMLVLHY